MFDHALEKTVDFVVAGALAALGGVASYIYTLIKRNDKFRFSSFFLNAFLAFFVGQLIGSFIPLSYPYRDGILMLSGFSTWPILGLLEIYTTKYAERLLRNKLDIHEETSYLPEESKESVKDEHQH